MTWQHLNSLGVALQLRDRPAIKGLISEEEAESLDVEEIDGCGCGEEHEHD